MALISQLPWWTYVIMAPCAFFLCLLLNYIVNRINAARIEERYAQFLAKDYSSTSNQGTQSQQETMMRMETPKRAMSSPSCMQTHRVVSPEEQRNPNIIQSEPLAQTVVTRPDDVVSTSQAVNIASDLIFLHKTYKVQLATSSKSLDKLVTPNQENQIVEHDILPPEEQQNPNTEPETLVETVVKKPSDVSLSNVVLPIQKCDASNPKILRKVYNVSAKSIDKQTVIIKQESQGVGNEIVCEMRKKAKNCESMRAFKRMINDQYENKLRDWVSDTTITNCKKEINKDTGF